MFKTEPTFINNSMDIIISIDLDVLSHDWQTYFYGRTAQIETPLVSQDGGIDVYRYQSIKILIGFLCPFHIRESVIGAFPAVISPQFNNALSKTFLHPSD